MILNTIPGFGLGSFTQKDIGLGLSLMFQDIIGGLTSIIGGYIYRDSGIEYFLYTGLSILGISKIFGIIGPFLYESKPLWPAIVMNLTVGFGTGNLYLEDYEGWKIQIWFYITGYPLGGLLLSSILILSVIELINNDTIKVLDPIVGIIFNFMKYIPLLILISDRVYGVYSIIYYYNNIYSKKNDMNNTDNEVTEPYLLTKPVIGISDSGHFIFGYGFLF